MEQTASSRCCWSNILLTVIVCAVSLATTGCLARRLKRLEIKQLQNELENIKVANEYLGTQPRLETNYGASAFISGAAINEFLKGLDNYDIPLDKPRGALVTVQSVRLEFKDGAPTLMVSAKAVDRTKTLEIRLRVRADIYFIADPANEQLLVKFDVREILPDIRLSIFRWREFWFAYAIIRLKTQDYVNSLPLIRLHLEPQFAVGVPASRRIDVRTGGGSITLLINTPSFNLGYKYPALKEVSLKDGIHVFFGLERSN